MDTFRAITAGNVTKPFLYLTLAAVFVRTRTLDRPNRNYESVGLIS